MERILGTAIFAASIACVAAPLGAAQSQSFRDYVRLHGDVSRMLIGCGPPVGLKEVVENTQLTVEGTVSLLQSAFDQEDRVYTDLVIDVIRVLRQRSPSASRTTPGPTDAWPFVASPAQPRPVGATPLRVRLRMIHHGRVVLEGGVVTETATGYPKLSVGQHIIVSAFFGELANAWLPWGFFEVREGRVVSLQPDHLRVKDYDSVDAFAAALANPPPTVTR